MNPPTTTPATFNQWWADQGIHNTYQEARAKASWEAALVWQKQQNEGEEEMSTTQEAKTGVFENAAREYERNTQNEYFRDKPQELHKILVSIMRGAHIIATSQQPSPSVEVPEFSAWRETWFRSHPSIEWAKKAYEAITTPYEAKLRELHSEALVTTREYAKLVQAKDEVETERDSLRQQIASVTMEREEAVQAIAKATHGASGLCCQLRLSEKSRADKLEQQLIESEAMRSEWVARAQRLASPWVSCLGLTTPYPITECLKHLIEATDHLLQGHSCDHHGYEVWMQAREHAQHHLTNILNTLPIPTLPAAEEKPDKCAKCGHEFVAGKCPMCLGDWGKQEVKPDEPWICDSCQGAEIGEYTYKPSENKCALGGKPRQLPTVELIPLEAKDVPPGTCFRHARFQFSLWNLATHVEVAGIHFMKSFVTFEELKSDGYEILRPGSTEWKACGKPRP